VPGSEQRLIVAARLALFDVQSVLSLSVRTEASIFTYPLPDLGP